MRVQHRMRHSFPENQVKPFCIDRIITSIMRGRLNSLKQIKVSLSDRHRTNGGTIVDDFVDFGIVTFLRAMRHHLQTRFEKIGAGGASFSSVYRIRCRRTEGLLQSSFHPIVSSTRALTMHQPERLRRNLRPDDHIGVRWPSERFWMVSPTSGRLRYLPGSKIRRAIHVKVYSTLTGDKAFVTGWTYGVGRTMVEAFADHGVTAAITSRTGSEAEAAA